MRLAEDSRPGGGAARVGRDAVPGAERELRAGGGARVRREQGVRRRRLPRRVRLLLEGRAQDAAGRRAGLPGAVLHPLDPEAGLGRPHRRRPRPRLPPPAVLYRGR